MAARPLLRLGCLLAAVALGCATAGQGGGEARWPRRVEFQSADGRTAFDLQGRDGEIRVRSGTGEVLALLRLEGEQLAIQDARGHTVAVVVPPSAGYPGIRVLRADRPVTLYELRSEPDGDFKLVDGRDRVVYKLKLRDYGFKVVRADGQVESRIRAGDEKISVRDASGRTFLYTRAPISREAAAAISLEQLRFEYAAGLAVAVAHWTPAGE